MQEFRDKLLWAARAAKWTRGGMAVRHLMHYLENSGRDYDADMKELLSNHIIAKKRDDMVDLAQGYEYELRLKPGAKFRSKELRQITPRSSGQGHVANEREREAWYSVGTFSAWLEVSVHPRALVVEFHLVDFYDWDQTGFTLPIPSGLCKRLDNPVVKRTVVTAIDKLSQHGRITRTGCSVTADDTVMNELHLMGLAKNYVTVGKHREEVPRSRPGV